MNSEMEEWLRSSLNERFYDGYPRDYLGNSLMLAVAAIQSPERTLSGLTENQYIRGGEDENVLHLRMDPEDIQENSFRQTGKLQVANLYYHALETLVRLFLAHRPGVERPWLEMAGETDFRRFKEKVARIARCEPLWDGSHPEDEWFRIAFWPEESTDERETWRLTAAKLWMNLAARETLDGPAYNAFKHGLAVQAGEEILGLYPKGEDPRQKDDAKPLVQAEGDALIVLRREKGPRGSRHWVRETRWLRLKERIAVIYVVQLYYLPALLAVGANRFLGRPLDELSLPEWGPGQALQHVYREGAGFRFTEFSQALGIVDPPKAKKRRKRRRN